MKKVTTFGELLLRLSAPGYERLFQTGRLDTMFCGSEANVAVSLANYGLDTSYVSKVPAGPIGDAALRSLRSFGVDVNGVLRGGERLGAYYLEKGASQRPSRVLYDRAGSAFALAKPEEYDWDTILEDSEWLHWTGIDPALSLDAAQATLDACLAAKRKGLTVSCDLNYRSKLWDVEAARCVMDRLVGYADVVMANEEDADKVLGITANSSDVSKGKLNLKGYEHVAGEICDRYGCAYVAFTLRESHSASKNGWSGLLWDASSKSSFISRKYDIELVDRVGGGDAFAAGIIYGLATDMSSQDTVEFATAASCLAQTIEGDLNLVSRNEVLSLMYGNGNGRVQR